MIHTPFSHLTDEELLSTGLFMEAPLTPLEVELLHRLEQHLDLANTCASFQYDESTISLPGMSPAGVIEEEDE